MIILHKDPEGTGIFSGVTGHSVSTWSSNARVAAGEGPSQGEAAHISTLRKRVTELEQELAQVKVCT